MNMYLAFIIHDISGIRSKETQKAASKQAACGSSNVHRCTDEAGSLAPPPPLAAAKRSDVDIQSPSWHDSSPLNFSSATFPALDLITHLVQIHSIAVKYICTFWKRSLHSLDFWPFAAVRAAGSRNAASHDARAMAFAAARGRRPESGVEWCARDGLLSNYKGPVGVCTTVCVSFNEVH